MSRTTLDIDGTVLRELKLRARRRGITAGRLASELLAQALAADEPRQVSRRLEWRTAPMNARVDLRDREALSRALEGR